MSAGFILASINPSVEQIQGSSSSYTLAHIEAQSGGDPMVRL